MGNKPTGRSIISTGIQWPWTSEWVVLLHSGIAHTHSSRKFKAGKTIKSQLSIRAGPWHMPASWGAILPIRPHPRRSGCDPWFAASGAWVMQFGMTTRLGPLNWPWLLLSSPDFSFLFGCWVIPLHKLSALSTASFAFLVSLLDLGWPSAWLSPPVALLSETCRTA